MAKKAKNRKGFKKPAPITAAEVLSRRRHNEFLELQAAGIGPGGAQRAGTHESRKHGRQERRAANQKVRRGIYD